MTKTKLEEKLNDAITDFNMEILSTGTLGGFHKSTDEFKQFVSDNYIPKEELIETIKGMKDIRDNKIKVYAGENGQILSNRNDYQKAHNQALKETIKIIKEL